MHITRSREGAGGEYAVSGSRDLPVGARQGLKQPIRFPDAAGDEPAGCAPLRRIKWPPPAANWVAPRSSSSHVEEGLLLFTRVHHDSQPAQPG